MNRRSGCTNGAKKDKQVAQCQLNRTPERNHLGVRRRAFSVLRGWPFSGTQVTLLMRDVSLIT